MSEALEMDRADRRLARERLACGHVDALARALAFLHAGSLCDPDDRADGAPEAILRRVRECAGDGSPDGEREAPPGVAADVERWLVDFITRHAERFRARAESGRVRRCPGILRLENVVIDAAGAATIAEANALRGPSRGADICVNLASLALDLSAGGAADLAERLLASFALAANDYDLYTLIDFYRSHVAWLRWCGDPQRAAGAGTAPVGRPIRGPADRWLHMALGVQRAERPRPLMVAMGGLVGSGKSTVARAIATGLAAPVVVADRTRSFLLGTALTDPAHEATWERSYAPGFGDEVYREVLRRSAVVLDAERSVVVDACFPTRALREAARRLAAARSADFLFVECRASARTIFERLCERARKDGVFIEDWLAIASDFQQRSEEVDEIPGPDHLVIDTARPLRDTMGSVSQRIADRKGRHEE